MNLTKSDLVNAEAEPIALDLPAALSTIDLANLPCPHPPPTLEIDLLSQFHSLYLL